MENQNKCQWERDDFCVNADCEHCADFCGHYENPEECECFETEQNPSASEAKTNMTDAVFIYWEN